MQVSVGGLACRITASNNTAIACDVGPGATGVAAISVSVNPSGLAAGNVSVARRFQVDSVEPQIGSTAGTERFCITRCIESQLIMGSLH